MNFYLQAHLKNFTKEFKRAVVYTILLFEEDLIELKDVSINDFIEHFIKDQNKIENLKQVLK